MGGLTQNFDDQQLLNLALKAALKAGEQVLKIYLSRSFGVQYKEDQSPVTEADLKACQVISRILNPSGLPIISEELMIPKYSERKNWEAYWLIDPIDGTREFVNRSGEFTVNIALIREGKPVLGVIFAPYLGSLYYGSGAGAFRIVRGAGQLPDLKRHEPEPLPAAEYLTKSGAIIMATSRSHKGESTMKFIEEKVREHGGVEVVGAGSSLKLCMVAEGSALYYPRFANTMEWDIAAGQAIVVAAGGTVTEYPSGEPITYNKPDLKNPWFLVSGKTAPPKK